MDGLYELHETPPLDAPALVVALDGWIDAGFGAARAVDVLVEQSESTHVASFDTDTLLDFRARRPVMHLIDGVNTGLTWSTIELHALRSPNGTDVLLLTGAEPDHAWHSFADAVLTLATDFGVRIQVGLGSFPAGVPHTRPVNLSATASTAELAAEFGFIQGTIDVPAGVEAVIEQRFASIDMPAIGIWSQVPHYASTFPYPAASARLIDGLNQITGADFAWDSLTDDIVGTRTRIDTLIRNNPEHVAMLQQLESQADEATEAQISNLPSGDDLAEELERFLREQDD